MQLQQILRDDIRRWLHERERRAWVGSEVAIVHSLPPLRARGSPAVTLDLHADVAVALDASMHPRSRWVIDDEHRNVDAVFLLARTNRLAALTTAARHVERGVAEAFVFDACANAVWGFRRNDRRVDAIPITTAGALRSRVLCADVVTRGGRLRLAPIATQELSDVLDRIDRALDRIARQRAS